MDVSRLKRVVLAALVAVVLASPFGFVAAAPPGQYIGPIPTSGEEIAQNIDAFNRLSGAGWGLAIVIFLVTFWLIHDKVLKPKRRDRREKGSVGEYVIPAVAGVIAVIILTPWLAGMFGLMTSGVAAPTADTSCSIKGPIELYVRDKVSGALITSGKVYLITKKMTLAQIIDSDAKGNLTGMQVRTLDSSGKVRFDNVAAGTYIVAYLPPSYAADQYEPTIANVHVSCAYKPNSDLLVTDISSLEVYKMKSVVWANEVGSSVISYTWKPSSYPADLDGFTVYLKAPDVSGRVPKLYLYLNYSEDAAAITVKIKGTAATVKKISDLEGTDPLRLNAPANYKYVITAPVVDPIFGKDTKTDVTISGTFQGNATIKLMPVAFADSQYGDIPMAEFTFTADNTAASPGWG